MSETNQSTAIQIAQAIADEIAAIEGAECAVLDLVPDFDLQDVKNLQIIVSPQGMTRGNKGAADRGAPDCTVKTNIAVLKKCGSKKEIPDMLTLSENIGRGIERKTVANLGIVSVVEFDPLYDMRVFRQMKVFIAVIAATIKVVK